MPCRESIIIMSLPTCLERPTPGADNDITAGSRTDGCMLPRASLKDMAANLHGGRARQPPPGRLRARGRAGSRAGAVQRTWTWRGTPRRRRRRRPCRGCPHPCCGACATTHPRRTRPARPARCPAAAGGATCWRRLWGALPCRGPRAPGPAAPRPAPRSPGLLPSFSKERSTSQVRVDVATLRLWSSS